MFAARRRDQQYSCLAYSILLHRSAVESIGHQEHRTQHSMQSGSCSNHTMRGQHPSAVRCGQHIYGLCYVVMQYMVSLVPASLHGLVQPQHAGTAIQ